MQKLLPHNRFSFFLLSGDEQESPARDTLPDKIKVQFSDASTVAIADTGTIAIEYIITGGSGYPSKYFDTLRLPNNIGAEIGWVLDSFGPQELQISANFLLMCFMICVESISGTVYPVYTRTSTRLEHGTVGIFF